MTLLIKLNHFASNITLFVVIALCLFTTDLLSQYKQVKIGTRSEGSKEIQLELIYRNQRYKNTNNNSTFDFYEEGVNSPKSVTFNLDGSKYYVQSLEGCQTIVFDSKTNKKIKVINHFFNKENNFLFKNNESTLFDYSFPNNILSPNVFSGKPVEACLSVDGKWLFVSYYRRSFDTNAQYPSAFCVIDTESDEIVRVIPTAPLPKMITCSPDGKYLSISHWGDNTVGVVDISTSNPNSFSYIQLLEVDKRAQLNYSTEKIIDRDNNCGNCLRGTAFTPDSKYLLISRMGGLGGIAIFRTSNFSKVGDITNTKPNIRHVLVDSDYIYFSVNKTGYVDKIKWSDVRYHFDPNQIKKIKDYNINSVFVGTGARTIVKDPKNDYIYVAINNESKIVVIRNSDWKVITEIDADSYPVGMAISPDGSKLIVTAQGKNGIGGNSVMIYKIIRN